MTSSAAVSGSGLLSSPSLLPMPSVPSPSITPPSASSNQRSTPFFRFWHRIPATFKRPRNVILATSIPLLASVYLSNPSHPLHQRIDALIAPLHSALFTYRHSHNQRRLFQHIRGDTIDLSPANTHNLTTLPQHLVYSALVINPYLLGRLSEVAQQSGYPAGTIAVGCGDASAEVRSVASESKDAVIASMLCSAKRDKLPVTRTADDGSQTTTEEEEWQSLLRECQRILKPGGKLYIVDYTAQSPASHPLAASVQRLLSPLSRLVVHNSALDTPIAQHVLTHAEEWESVQLERWQPHATPIPLTLHTSEDGSARVEGLGGGAVIVIGGVCVKRKAARLSEYVRGRENVLDELFRYGTFNTAPQPHHQQQQPTHTPRQHQQFQQRR